MIVVEMSCVSCGSPCGTKPIGSSMHVTCDDICLGMYLDRLPSGHFARGSSGPLCGGVNLCDLHERLAERERAWRQREGL